MCYKFINILYDTDQYDWIHYIQYNINTLWYDTVWYHAGVHKDTFIYSNSVLALPMGEKRNYHLGLVQMVQDLIIHQDSIKFLWSVNLIIQPGKSKMNTIPEYKIDFSPPYNAPFTQSRLASHLWNNLWNRKWAAQFNFLEGFLEMLRQKRKHICIVIFQLGIACFGADLWAKHCDTAFAALTSWNNDSEKETQWNSLIFLLNDKCTN